MRNGNEDEKKEIYISIREFLEQSLESLDRITQERFSAIENKLMAALEATEKSFNAALQASNKNTATIFQANKEALYEAQSQLTQYKLASNEWRGTLNDLIAKIMLRPEIEKGILDTRSSFDIKLDSLDKRVQQLEKTPTIVLDDYRREYKGLDDRLIKLDKDVSIRAVAATTTESIKLQDIRMLYLAIGLFVSISGGVVELLILLLKK